MTVVSVSTPGTKGLFLWMQRALPRTYVGVKKELTRNAGPGLNGFGLSIEPATTASTTAPSTSLANTIRDIATTVGQAYLTTQQVKAQQQILNIQLQRAQQGLAPLAIDPTTYGLPQPSIGVSLDPNTRTLLMYVAGGIGVALILGLVGGGRASRKR